ncbi:TPA: PHP domain-containing protein [Thermoplasmata archaeon]|nr:PHP domain-containing protein [Thermoplasmata archaeon]
MKLDLHIHSKFSRDGAATVEDILGRCRSLGLDGCSITDHNSIDGSIEAFELAHSFGLLVVRGIEISTSEGHVLAYGLSSTVPSGLAVAETIQRVHEAGGIAVAAHPRRFPSGLGIRRASKESFDAVEILNGGSSRASNKSSAALATRIGLPGVGGSDAHRIEEIGRAATVLQDVTSERQVIDSILGGKTSVVGRSRNVQETVVYAKETLTEWVRGGFKRM